MRKRITAAFVVLALLLLLAAGLIEGYALQGQLRERAAQRVTGEATALGALVSHLRDEGTAVDAAVLRNYVGRTSRVEYAVPGTAAVVVSGAAYDGTRGADPVSATVPVRGATLTVSQDPADVLTLSPARGRSTLALLLLLLALAGAAGYLTARALGAPFRQLATAAAALGRGRFELDLPRTRVPEARAIAEALAGSADQQRVRVERERRFSGHVSHVLRTPLTRLRLHLEELTMEERLPADAHDAAARGLRALEELDAAAGELVALSSPRTLVEGAAVPLREVAVHSAQRWSDRLAGRGRRLNAAVEGDVEVEVTPGPIENVLDLLLTDVTDGCGGAVRLVLEGRESHVRVSVRCDGDSPHGTTPEELAAHARPLVDVLGGVVEPGDASHGLSVLLPRR